MSEQPTPPVPEPNPAVDPVDAEIEWERTWSEYDEEFFGEDNERRPWLVAALRGLVDVQFRQSATRVLLPVVYILGLLLAFAAPAVLTVGAFFVDTWAGIASLVVVQPLLTLAFAATIRLLLEFLLSARRLAQQAGNFAQLADELHETLAQVAEPVSRLSDDVRAVQFWRFRQRRPSR